jgi:hypothetical protein
MTSRFPPVRSNRIVTHARPRPIRSPARATTMRIRPPDFNRLHIQGTDEKDTSRFGPVTASFCTIRVMSALVP